jgi:hypothetical protein
VARYCIFVLSTLDKKIERTLERTHIFVCNSDTEAVSRAAEHLQDGYLVEIWQNMRVVGRLRSEDARPA